MYICIDFYISISRKKVPNRKVHCENEIWLYLKNLGFEEFLPEEYSVSEQANKFNEAEIIVAPHGLGLINCVFCEPGTKIFVTMPQQDIVTCFWSLCNRVNLNYWYLMRKAERIQYSKNSKLLFSDFNMIINME